MTHNFKLRKWYFDCIDESGHLVIAYVGIIDWKKIRLSFSSLLTKKKEVEVVSSLGKVELPVYSPGELKYKAKLFEIELEKIGEPVREILLDCEEGGIEWNCYYPSNRVSVRSAPINIKGLGYAEELSMSIKPWEMKIKDLYWGRYVSGKHSITWIEWKGEWPRFFIWHNGKKHENGSIENNKVVFGSFVLMFLDIVTLRSGSLLSTAFKKFPLFKRLFPLKALVTEETKWKAKGRLFVNNKPVDEGWCIFEKVSWV